MGTNLPRVHITRFYRAQPRRAAMRPGRARALARRGLQSTRAPASTRTVRYFRRCADRISAYRAATVTRSDARAAHHFVGAGGRNTRVVIESCRHYFKTHPHHLSREPIARLSVF